MWFLCVLVRLVLEGQEPGTEIVTVMPAGPMARAGKGRFKPLLGTAHPSLLCQILIPLPTVPSQTILPDYEGTWRSFPG